MVRNQTISSSVSAELTESFQKTITVDKVRRFEQVLGLPTTLPGFLLLTLAVLLVCAGMALLVMTSVQTFQTRLYITRLEQELNATERQNAELVWQIAQFTSLEDVRRRASALGYEAPTVRHFATVAGAPGNLGALPSAQPAANSAPVSPTPADSGAWQWLQAQIDTIRSWW